MEKWFGLEAKNALMRLFRLPTIRTWIMQMIFVAHKDIGHCFAAINTGLTSETLVDWLVWMKVGNYKQWQVQELSSLTSIKGTAPQRNGHRISTLLQISNQNIVPLVLNKRSTFLPIRNNPKEVIWEIWTKMDFICQEATSRSRSHLNPKVLPYKHLRRFYLSGKAETARRSGKYAFSQCMQFILNCEICCTVEKEKNQIFSQPKNCFWRLSFDF